MDVAKNLNDVFLDGVEPEAEEVLVAEVLPPKIATLDEDDDNKIETIDRETLAKRNKADTKDLDADYQETREIYDDLIKSGKKAIGELAVLADEMESARAYEVLGGLIKNVTDVAVEKMDLHVKMKKIKEDSGSKGGVTNTAIFFGSTDDLQRMLKKTKLAEITERPE